MSSNRRSNVQAKRTAGQAGGRRPRTSLPKAPARGSAVGDIIGVSLIVLAVAMAISVLSPSSAPVTRATGEFLGLCFGVGALLCPLSIALFAGTFFLDGEEPVSGRMALGLALVVLAVLGLLSINMSSAEADPLLVFDKVAILTRGGYVGGAIAWTLLSFVGRTVGNVILAGMALAGVIVCGFSVSGLVARIRSAADGVIDAGRSARERRRDARAAYSSPEPEPYVGRQPPLEETATTFLGSRKTSVLTRGRAREEASEGDLPTESCERPTRLLGRRRHPDIDVELSRPAQEVAATGPASALDREASDEQQLSVPDFLLDAAPAKGRRGSKRGDAPSKAPAASPVVTKRQVTSARSEATRPGDDVEGYELPPFSMLSSNPNSASSSSSKDELDHTKARLQGTLEEFGLSSKVVDYVSGPLVTTFRVEMGEGERVNKIRNLEDDIALTLAAEKVRIFAPIPGTSFVGIEIPNQARQNVHLGDVLPHASGGPLEVAIGRDSAGRPVVADIAKMPHMLVAGTTGSGKSVMINSMIMSLLMRTTPKQVRLIMIDPKRVEFSGYNGLPHLYVPVVTEPRQAASALSWAVSEMERRLKVFERAQARDIKVYNKMCVSGKLSEMDNPPEPMPFLVIVIDELSDLMMVAGKDVEASIVRIAQLARAAGIHLVIATQRPSANVVTGLIKSNIDSRIALKVSSGIDSRVILDETGAERLLGHGDMLFKDRGLSPKRVLGCYTSDSEINSVVEFIRDQAEPDYHEEILSQVVPGQPSSGSGEFEEEDDPLVWEAAQIVVDSQLGSTSGLQRRLKVGYARAGRIMDMLESKGVVGPPDGSKPREVLLDKDGLEDLRTQEEKYREV